MLCPYSIKKEKLLSKVCKIRKNGGVLYWYNGNVSIHSILRCLLLEHSRLCWWIIIWQWKNGSVYLKVLGGSGTPKGNWTTINIHQRSIFAFSPPHYCPILAHCTIRHSLYCLNWFVAKSVQLHLDQLLPIALQLNAVWIVREFETLEGRKYKTKQK